MTAKLFLSCLGLLVLLSACNGEEATPPPPQPNTAINQAQAADSPTPAPTRLVTLTPRPSATFTPAPTLDEALFQYEGTWGLLLRYDISESEALGNLSYSTLASITVSFDGFVSGNGSFTPTFQSPTCSVQVANIEALQYRIDGRLERASDGVYMTLNVILENPEVAESYKRFCADPLDRTKQTESSIEGAILASLLQNGDQLTYRFNLDVGVISQTFTGDLSSLTNRQFDGQIQGQLQFSRS
jgi:hypothetical protein